MEKKCFKCGRVLHISMFYRHQQMKDGYLNKCKECTVLDTRLHREMNGDKIRDYDRARHSDRHKVKFEDRYPLKNAAETTINNAVKYGKIAKPLFCVRCWDAGKIHGHHRDYSNKLDVIWLCPRCHATEHETRKYDCSDVARLRGATLMWNVRW